MAVRPRARPGGDATAVPWLPDQELVVASAPAVLAGAQVVRQFLEVDGVDSEDDPGVEAAVRDEGVLAGEVLAGGGPLVDEGVERRPEVPGDRVPGGELFVAGGPFHGRPEVSVVEEVVMGPIVERGP